MIVFVMTNSSGLNRIAIKDQPAPDDWSSTIDGDGMKAVSRNPPVVGKVQVRHAFVLLFRLFECTHNSCPFNPAECDDVIPPMILEGALAGSLVGFVLGLIGGGGSILAVPLLVYFVGVQSPHVAIGTSAVAVAASAIFNVVGHARGGRVKWPCALAFSAAGILGAAMGASLAKSLDGGKLLALFGGLMLVVGVSSLLRKGGEGDPSVRLTFRSYRLGATIVAAGLLVGALSGFFGIGGGFLIVPALMWATGMPMSFAIGTSLVAVTAFGLTTAATYATSGLVDWPLAMIFILGGVAGGFAGIRASVHLGQRKGALGRVFGAIVVVVGLYVVWRGLPAFTHRPLAAPN